jgi:molecular chaperone Hsp33
MTLAGRIAWDDTVLPFQLDHADIRGRVGRLDSVLETILGQHDYPTPVAALVAEAALITALIGQTIKLRWRLSLQIRGDGPVRLIATDYFGPTEEGQPARMRAYAGYDAEGVAAADGAAPFGLIGKGVFGILIDQGPGTTPYQGMTPVAGASLADCAETYFAQSEQLPTRFALAMGEAVEPGGEAHWRGGGLLLQHMPKASPHAKEEGATGPDGLLAAEDVLDGADAENWRRAVMLLDTVEATELIGPHVGTEQLLLRLFSDEGPRVYSAQPVRFGCTCGPEKVVATLASYTADEIATLTTAEGKVTADCQFCGAHYEFDPDELGADRGPRA